MADFRCAISSSSCSVVAYHRVFLWRKLSRRQEASTTSLFTCMICDHHYQHILDEHRGAVPDITADTKTAVLDYLKRVCEDENTSLDIYDDNTCTTCTNDASMFCERCEQPICRLCHLYGGYYCCLVNL